jgi:hypothetical protein
MQPRSSRTLLLSLALGAALGVAAPVRVGAQDPVVKPTTNGTYDRLPAPAKITATQQSDGRIRVAWSPVEGAARYALTRSVPNIGSGLVARPNPLDTTYVDADVRAGYYYYYVVFAVNDAGVGGMKVSAPPVISTMTVGTTTTAAVPSRVIEPPARVAASLDPYPYASASWTTSQSGVRFDVERGTVSGTDTTWLRIGGNRVCCWRNTDYLSDVPVGTRLVYRVTAIDSTLATNRSAPVVTNEITTFKISALAAVAGVFHLSYSPAYTTPAQMALGQSSPAKELTNPRWVSLNEPVATVEQNGLVTAHGVGSVYVVAVGLTSAGAVESVVYRIDVAQSP